MNNDVYIFIYLCIYYKKLIKYRFKFIKVEIIIII